MKTKAIQELRLENFQKYGTFASMLNPQAVKIGEKPIEFFRDMIHGMLDFHKKSRTQTFCLLFIVLDFGQISTDQRKYPDHP